LSSRTGFLLVNLGSPAAPTAAAVRRFLAQFLADPRVVALPRLLWLPILHGIILRTRPARSAAKYAEIWTDEGSPLTVHTIRQTKLLRGLLGSGGPPVEYAMRYGDPSPASAIERLRAAGCSEVKVLPLYPQYSESTTASVEDSVKAALADSPAQSKAPLKVAIVRDFHDHPAYVRALASIVRKHRESQGRGNVLVMSFHGLPQRAVDRGDPYQRQCETSARLLAEELGLDSGEFRVCYQSRFGAAKWIGPYTEPTLISLAQSGVGEVDVVFPGFSSDCLETLEEIGIGAKQTFLAAGGRELRLIPCLNESPDWIAALPEIIEERSRPAGP